MHQREIDLQKIVRDYMASHCDGERLVDVDRVATGILRRLAPEIALHIDRAELHQQIMQHGISYHGMRWN